MSKHYQYNEIVISLVAFICLLIKTNFKEKDRCFSTLFSLKCTTWDLKLLHFCLFGFFFSWLDPKKWNKKFSESFVVWNCRVLWELFQIPDVSQSALNSPIFGNNASSHFRKLCFVHFTEPLLDTMCLKRQQPCQPRS